MRYWIEGLFRGRVRGYSVSGGEVGVVLDQEISDSGLALDQEILD